MTIYANVYGGQLTVDLTGPGTSGVVSLTPAQSRSDRWRWERLRRRSPVTRQNSGTAAIPINSIIHDCRRFVLLQNTCGTTSLAANTDCQLQVEFAPTQAGAATGTLTFIDGAGTQTVELSGTGAAAPTDRSIRLRYVFRRHRMGPAFRRADRHADQQAAWR